ncbi:PAX3- and PAX7-binding protein 1-like [Huso huso]|uniref:PAX3- and PAX7-binding protein 1-like n=1 Tax=Huso huso TaxID=61971 RepID=A0ABR0ZPE2_HUSHU
MFKKAKRVNFRRRNESDEEEKEEEKQSPPQPQLLQEQPQPCGADDEPSVRCAVINNPEIIAHFNVSTDMNHGNGFQTNTTRMNLKEKKKSKENKDVPKASLLSFHDEEDDIEVFKVKKSNYNKKIVKQLKKEYKEDLEKAGGSKQDPSTAGDELTTVMMSVKEEPMTEESVANSDKGEEEMEVDSNNESDVDQKSNPAGAFSNALSSLNTLRPGEIPDAAFIHAARKRRQLARELGDNVPPENEPGGNRLVREDENDASDDEDDDEKRRIIFSVKEKTQRQKIAEEIGIEGSDDEALDAGDQDEELNRWEQEQIRKGISIPQVQASQQADVNMYYQSTYEAASYVSSYGLPYSYSSYGSDVSKPVKSENSVTYTAPSNGMMPITTDLVKKRLKDRLDSMKGIHSSNQKRYEQIQQELESSTSMIARLEGSSDGGADQYKFLQEMRGYVRDLLECFGEKVPLIHDLESAMQQLLRQRASRLVQRRQDDIKDESSEFASHSSKALMAPNLDSFGRDRGVYQEHAKQRRIAEREARRTRRRQAREQNGKRAEHHEGLSSDDEETSTDITSFNLEKDRILKESKKVFEDVLEDFCSIDSIKSRFEVWRKMYLKCYQDAYIGLCLPKLFNPLVRLQLIPWNPLMAECPDFEYMLWFESLLFYGCEEERETQKGDVDILLLPAIVERVIVPKLAVLADQVWDPLSSSQTTQLVSFMQRLIRGYPSIMNGENRNTQELLKAIVMRTRRTLDNDVFMPLYPKNVLENKNSGPYLFFQRQFWSSIKLLGNILQWHGILSNTCLRELAVDSLLNRYILSALQNSDPGEDSITKSQSVIDCFPKQWFTNIKGQQTIPQLENFCRYLKHLASTIYRVSIGVSDVEKRNAREHIKQVVRLLGSVSALDHVVAVASEHGIKDVKALLEGK